MFTLINLEQRMLKTLSKNIYFNDKLFINIYGKRRPCRMRKYYPNASWRKHDCSNSNYGKTRLNIGMKMHYGIGPGQMLDLSVGKHEHNKNTQPTEWYCKNACSKHAAKSNLFYMHIHTLSLSQT
jgi:hypothetical protein